MTVKIKYGKITIIIKGYWIDYSLYKNCFITQDILNNGYKSTDEGGKMGFFDKKIGQVFIKEESDTQDFIDKMSKLSAQATGALKKDIDKQIKLAQYGMIGEKNIAFELKNSDIDMYILHDLYFEYENLSAQIDYLIITRKNVYIIECKNLIGNIEVDHNGNFIRTYELFGKKVKEGIYSPITQNERHRLVLKKMRMEGQNFITKMVMEKTFEQNHKILVVLANPKTYLNAKFAKKEIKDQIIRADQLIAYIKEEDKKVSNADKNSDEYMLKLANYYLDKNKKGQSDYAEKYEKMLQEVNHILEQNQKEEKKDKKEIKEIKEKIHTEPITSDCDKKGAERSCPVCGNKLILRTAKQGTRIGKKFWGCSAFPKCRFIENIE